MRQASSLFFSSAQPDCWKRLWTRTTRGFASRNKALSQVISPARGVAGQTGSLKIYQCKSQAPYHAFSQSHLTYWSLSGSPFSNPDNLPEHHGLRPGLTSLKGSSAAAFVPQGLSRVNTYTHSTDCSGPETKTTQGKPSDLESSKKVHKTRLLAVSAVLYCSLLTWPRSLFQVPSPMRGIFCPVWRTTKSHAADIFA